MKKGIEYKTCFRELMNAVVCLTKIQKGGTIITVTFPIEQKTKYLYITMDSAG
jgi:hypothetical protein